jgi:hypothetical protein
VFLLKKLGKLKGDLHVMNPHDAAAWKRIARQVGHLNEIGQQAAAASGDGAGPTKH